MLGPSALEDTPAQSPLTDTLLATETPFKPVATIGVFNMADTAFQTQYRQEFIAGYEVKQSLLRQSVTTEAVTKGNTATFLVADSGGATAVTRGVNGLIPARADNLTQTSATLVEWHDLVRKTGFNIFASQGDQRRIMQETSMGVINRKVDTDILGELANTTQNTGTAQTASLALVMKSYTILANNAVPLDGNITGVISPAFHAYLMQAKEFTNVQYIGDVKPFTSQPILFRWANINWIVTPLITGVGTSAEKCFLYHRNAIGHAMDTKEIQTAVGVMEEQDYSYARTSATMGAKLLQTLGCVQMNHDGSAYVSS